MEQKTNKNNLKVGELNEICFKTKFSDYFSALPFKQKKGGGGGGGRR